VNFSAFGATTNLSQRLQCGMVLSHFFLLILHWAQVFEASMLEDLDNDAAGESIEGAGFDEMFLIISSCNMTNGIKGRVFRGNLSAILTYVSYKVM
jgi:hypothetical protein